eukprot:scaffold129775_cov63-Phaeocystis_antarctica.AAC.4
MWGSWDALSCVTPRATRHTLRCVSALGRGTAVGVSRGFARCRARACATVLAWSFTAALTGL